MRLHERNAKLSQELAENLNRDPVKKNFFTKSPGGEVLDNKGFESADRLVAHFNQARCHRIL